MDSSNHWGGKPATDQHPVQGPYSQKGSRSRSGSSSTSANFWLKLSWFLDQDQNRIHKEVELIFGSNFGLTLIHPP